MSGLDVNRLERGYLKEYDPLIEETRTFVGELGLEITDDVFVVTSQTARDAGMSSTASGEYDRDNDIVVATVKPEGLGSLTDATRLKCALVHEFGHSGTLAFGQPVMLREAYAGMAEAEYLRYLVAQGRHRTPPDFTLEHAGKAVHVSGTLRHLHADEWDGIRIGPKAISSYGLLAALGVSYGLEESGTDPRELLRSCKLDGQEQYVALGEAINRIDPSLMTELYIRMAQNNELSVVEVVSALQGRTSDPRQTIYTR